MIHYFFITEGWAITLIVLLYTVWAFQKPRRNAWIKYVVPLVISVSAHLFMLFFHSSMDIRRCISDMGYDWLAPLGIYGIGVSIKAWITERKRGG